MFNLVIRIAMLHTEIHELNSWLSLLTPTSCQCGPPEAVMTLPGIRFLPSKWLIQAHSHIPASVCSMQATAGHVGVNYQVASFPHSKIKLKNIFSARRSLPAPTWQIWKKLQVPTFRWAQLHLWQPRGE